MAEPLPMHDRVAAAWWDRDVVRAHGPDAISFLQGQLSQDIEGLDAGEAAWSFLLDPQGKLEAVLRIVREPDGVVMHVDAGFGEAVVERIERFKLRVKAEVELLPWRVLAVRGPAGSAAGAGAEPPGECLVAPAGHPGYDGYDLIGEAPGPPDGMALVESVYLRAALIEAGIPTMGVDIEVGAIPAETGLVEKAASFTKGCYTGQELVARIDSRGGRAPRHLVGVRFEGGPGALPEPGTVLVVDGSEAGVLTSIVGPPVRIGGIGLARVKRSIEVPATAEVAGGGGVARLESLPLVS